MIGVASEFASRKFRAKRPMISTMVENVISVGTAATYVSSSDEIEMFSGIVPAQLLPVDQQPVDGPGDGVVEARNSADPLTERGNFPVHSLFHGLHSKTQLS